MVDIETTTTRVVAEEMEVQEITAERSGNSTIFQW